MDIKCKVCHAPIGSGACVIINECEGGSVKLVYYHVPCFKDVAKKQLRKRMRGKR